ncbi:heterogeneous nuclear ribonucleoprotein 27C [Anopheles merus]|uniref:AGAP001930-PA n=3 Tax=gambiae species complex TaxID=44542 RepID=Q7PYG5_ANOGA|nr:heterogeneous nuclear ribonucleoprotein 27C [Anopheles gambiae]XP_040227715.1 heterogeneous nuclear ribonucleoprotein 27C [Anopheles coluzzii]XP_040227716.1 heterogeneous nuclear ribonucleoprotein 27C [Anopheles coluzzii]XP_040227717.1 heterogeneous nuclear ribonucleoprotein 27C [Anopheles coluzzii]XP_041765133.1 heterogeneous nuclear ribonucleoprotein 27C [Anopheles merus]XP_041765134.1 heterogeneous nuclear ribonucleoprotein 27C [Anopheles merus]XP_041765135.1 heterogeneous nuclear ribon
MHPSKKMIPAELDDHEKGKLFVGGLSWETSHENLQRYFSRYGEVIDCVVMKNNETGRSRGFGFVTFADPENVERALENGPHTLDGRTIDPKPCNPRSQHKPKRTGGYPKVFLGGLPPNITETDLRSFFCRYGTVMEVVIMYDQEKKKSRGFGFLSFENESAVERATTDHFVHISGKQVEVKKAEPRDGNQNNSNSMNTDSYQWGSPQAPPMGNGQMGGPPINMQSNMIQGYQGWGTSQPQQGYGGYGAGAAGAANAYQSWGAPPPPQQWGNYNATPQQTQGYGGYDMYNNSGAGSAGGYGSGNWNSWNMPPNTAGSAAGSTADMYTRPQSGPTAGPGASAGPTSGGPSKPGSEYGGGSAAYGGGAAAAAAAAAAATAGYNYYQSDQNTYNNRPRSVYGAGSDATSQPPYQAF